MLTRKISMIGLLCLLLTGCKVELYGGLNEREANEMVAILLSNGIDSSRNVTKDGVATVFAEKARFADAVMLLKNAGLPREEFASMGEVFSREGLVSSPSEERARYIFALSQELSETLSQIDGVLSARVHVVLPEDDPFRQEVKPSSASIFIRHLSSADIGVLVPEIKTLVTNGIEGVSYDNVSVALFPSAVQISQNRVEPYKNLFGIRIHSTSFFPALIAIGLSVIFGLLGIAFGLLMWQLWRRDNASADLIETVRQWR